MVEKEKINLEIEHLKSLVSDNKYNRDYVRKQLELSKGLSGFGIV